MFMACSRFRDPFEPDDPACRVSHLNYFVNRGSAQCSVPSIKRKVRRLSGSDEPPVVSPSEIAIESFI
jgi:hypothetical protein